VSAFPLEASVDLDNWGWRMKDDGRAKLIGGLEIITGLGIAVFWILFFTVGLAPAAPPACYFRFEHSLVFPDAVLGGLLVGGGWLLATGKQLGRLLSLPAGGALFFLGIADASFNATNGIYSHDTLQIVQNVALNAWCIGFGASIVFVIFQTDGQRLSRAQSASSL
jgi:hypothetical protein